MRSILSHRNNERTAVSYTSEHHPKEPRKSFHLMYGSIQRVIVVQPERAVTLRRTVLLVFMNSYISSIDRGHPSWSEAV